MDILLYTPAALRTGILQSQTQRVPQPEVRIEILQVRTTFIETFH